jgi:putative heme-binding domain-containing protein
LLVERAERSVAPELERLARESHSPLGRLHALYTLDALGALTLQTILTALGDATAEVRMHALRLSEAFLGEKPDRGPAGEEVPPDKAGSARSDPSDALTGKLEERLLGVVGDADARVRFQLALSLGEMKDPRMFATLAHLARRDPEDPWHLLATLSSLAERPWLFLKELVGQDPSLLSVPETAQARLLEQAGRLVGANHSEPDLAECLDLIGAPPPVGSAPGRLVLLAGVSEGLAFGSHSLRQMFKVPPPSLARVLGSVKLWINHAAQAALTEDRPMRERLSAVRVLGRVEPDWVAKAILSLIEPKHPGPLQAAAVDALVELAEPALAQKAYTGWSGYTVATRRRLLAASVRRQVLAGALLTALQQGQVAPVELDVSTRQALRKLVDEARRADLERLLQWEEVDREQVIRSFAGALQMEGDAKRGAPIFARTCLICHALGGKGTRIGPDLSGLSARPTETLLVDVLDPSRQVSSDFLSYTIETRLGEEMSGLIVGESGEALTLRRANQSDEMVPRSQIRELRVERKSLMPDGLEAGLSNQDMADLLAFLRRSDAKLLPEQ